MVENECDGKPASLRDSRPAEPDPAGCGRSRGAASLARPGQRRQRPPFECIALVLQGGGALGAYQAGTYEALAEAGLRPDWVAGISIGAINAAIIAGNPPGKGVGMLRGFWEHISTEVVPIGWTAWRPG